MARSRGALASATAGLALLLSGCFSTPDEVEVTIDDGTLVGLDDEGVRSWLGIPYAAPPEGDLRWRPPQPPDSWSGDRDAKEYSEHCQQSEDGQPVEGEEDCLYLNVFRDDSDADELPVMVWIHGGGLNSGSGDLPIDTVSGLVDQDVLLVSINYRVGRLGFFTHPALAEENEQPVANFGFLDQIAALEWVQRNIGAFGGDPDNVTIFGISAGGASVNALMASPAARGLFHRAIAGSPLGRERPEPWATAQARGEALIAGLGEPDADADALRSLDGEEVAALPSHILRNEVPIIDSVLPESVADTFAAGKEAPVPYLVGTTDLELLDGHFGVIGVDAPSVRAQLAAGREDEADAAYGDDNEFARHFLNDLIFTEPARYLAELHAQRAPTYLYRFGIVGDEVREEYGGAPHGADLPYVFGYRSPDRAVDDSGDLADDVSGCWGTFATSGKPSCGGTAWPTAKDGDFVEFTNEGPVVVTDDPWGARLDLAQAISTALAGA